MKALVVYDSNFGNTKLIAEEVAEHLGNDVRTLSVREFTPKDMAGVELLVLGSPINGWNATPTTMKVLDRFKEHDFDGVKFSTFDTRIKLFIHGDAKDKLAEVIAEKCVELIAEPREFYVTGRVGPLFQGEIESAAQWANQIMKKI